MWTSMSFVACTHRYADVGYGLAESFVACTHRLVDADADSPAGPYPAHIADVGRCLPTSPLACTQRHHGPPLSSAVPHTLTDDDAVPANIACSSHIRLSTLTGLQTSISRLQTWPAHIGLPTSDVAFSRPFGLHAALNRL
ncbi:hypothetical protein H5410_014723 [Solanum commersonii]|uniref:Uncharacterized protein n=1 Tax=Solanum commersonii TaxID=4109 RepID=A0A9J5ZS18_SOLCO|nr:hypothetical protein H5410_014723 [Solanum commersonii]